MEIVCLTSSPRKRGNSTLIAQRFCAAARGAGAAVRTFDLNALTFRGCQACRACKLGKDTCALKDDLDAVLEAVRGADCLFLASPVYFGDVASPMKAFIDRTYSFLTPEYREEGAKASRLAPGKSLVFALTQGGPAGMFADIFPRYDFFFEWHGFTERHLLRGCDLSDPAEVEGRPELLESAAALARRLTS
jgi:multimeric flavodoxin WrbA